MFYLPNDLDMITIQKYMLNMGWLISSLSYQYLFNKYRNIDTVYRGNCRANGLKAFVIKS